MITKAYRCYFVDLMFAPRYTSSYQASFEFIVHHRHDYRAVQPVDRCARQTGHPYPDRSAGPRKSLLQRYSEAGTHVGS